MERGFGRDRRLRSRSDFERVFRRGKRLGGSLFVMIALPNVESGHRLGLAVSRRVGPATTRNEVRRRLREGFRRLPPGDGQGFDLVVVARPDIVGRAQAEVNREIEERVQRLTGRRRRGRKAGSAPD